jgi:hypothetical protein
MKKRLVDTLLEEVVIDGDRQIQIKFRSDLVNLVGGNKEEASRSDESDNRHTTLLDNGQIVIQL